MSPTMMILVACIFGAGIGLFGLNYFHARNCGAAKSPSEIEEYLQALNNRLREAESKAINNGVLVDRLLRHMQSKLIKLENSELERLTKSSRDEAVRISMILASQPAPPMPAFELDAEYIDAEKLGDKIDDILANTKETGDFYGSFEGDDKERKDSSLSSLAMSDVEATKLCIEWMKNYSVVTGVSWGNLPYDLQQKWLMYSCDYHVGDGADSGNSRNNKFDDVAILGSENSKDFLTEGEGAGGSTMLDDYLEKAKARAD